MGLSKYGSLRGSLKGSDLQGFYKGLSKYGYKYLNRDCK